MNKNRQVLGAGKMVKNTDRSSGEPRFGCQYPYGGSQLSVTTNLGIHIQF